MIYEEKIRLELDILYENSKFIDMPYYVDRIKKDNEIVWYGLETNWKFFDNNWHILKGKNWIVCDKPEYEKVYEKDLGILKLERKEKLNKINELH